MLRQVATVQRQVIDTRPPFAQLLGQQFSPFIAAHDQHATSRYCNCLFKAWMVEQGFAVIALLRPARIESVIEEYLPGC
ncbi:hypothetical protein ALP75_204442 [Pseudomonas syringae pv. actinidiae]|nr:hypothetical protein ALP75_204442 [Pseudomonas syringae pv. actinidiae]